MEHVHVEEPDLIDSEHDLDEAFVRSLSPWTVSRAACSLYHSMCIIKAIDIQQIYVWGRNHNNVLGLNISTYEQATPSPLEYFIRNNIAEVACGINHSMVLVKDNVNALGGKLYAMGLGNRGRLGFSKTDNDESEDDNSWFTPKPIRVRFPNKRLITRVACGSDHTLAITQSGDLYAWGCNQYGNLGLGHTRDQMTPAQIAFPSPKTQIVHCAAAGKHSIACDIKGNCYSWGHNGSSRLGLGHTRAMFQPTQIDSVSNIWFVSAGEAHSACIDNKGVLYTWGAGSYGRLGHGDEYDISVPKKVEEFSGKEVVQVSCGTFHTLSILEKGELYGWGSGLGVGLTAEGDNIINYVPKQLDPHKFGAPVCFVRTAVYHTIAINLTGDVFCWGISGHSRLGHGHDANCAFPEHVVELRNRGYVNDLKQFFITMKIHESSPKDLHAMYDLKPWHVVRVQCGTSHTMILTASGCVWVWGSNSHGQLGLGSLLLGKEINRPTQINVFKEPIQTIACGGNHSLAANVFGQLFSWGAGEEGQLGIGRAVDCCEPMGIVTLSGVFAIEAGDNYSACLALTQFEQGTEDCITAEAGELWTWGSGETGKLGHKGVLSGKLLTPKKVQLSTIISNIACGLSHMVVCNPLGAIFTWGAGYYGRLGIGVNINSDVPLRVSIPDNEYIVSVAAGDFHSMALSETGNIFVWGRDTAVCSDKHITEPQLLSNIYNEYGTAKCKAIYAANEHSFAITLNDQLWAWGNNSQKQLGVEKKKFDFISEPMLVQLNNAIETLGVSPNFTVAVLKRGAIYAWGQTMSGCLGCGPTDMKFATAPQAVTPTWMQQDIIPLAIDKADEEINPNVNVSAQSIQEKTYFLLEKIRSATEELPFSAIQELLKAEPAMYQLQHIKFLEDDLIKIYDRFLDSMKMIPEIESEYNNLKNRVKKNYTSLILNLEYTLPEPSPSEFNDRALRYYFSRIETIKEIVYCLQMQPAYFYILLKELTNIGEMEILLESIYSIYNQIDDEHVNAAFLGILAALCTLEVEQATDLVHLFDPVNSKFINLLSVYASMSQNFKHFGAPLVDLKSKYGCAYYLNKVDTTVLALEPNKLRDIYTELQINVENIDDRFKQCIEMIKLVLSSLHQSINFPQNICAIIKHAYDIILNKTCIFDDGSSGYLRTSFTQIYPVIRLIVQGIIGKIWKSPRSYADSIMGVDLSDKPITEMNFRTLWTFINSAFQDNFTEYEYGHIFRDIFQRMYYSLSNAVVELVSSVPDGFLFVQGTLSLFAVHFKDAEFFVTLRSDYTAGLINALKTYKKKLQFSAYDPITEAINKLCPSSGSLVFPLDIIKDLKAKPYTHNVYFDRRFYVNTQTAVVDSITNIIIPQNLAYRQQAAVKEGSKVVAFLRRFAPPSIFESRYIIQECLRDLPALKSTTWECFLKELNAAHAFYMKQKTPQYSKAEIISKTINAVTVMENQDAKPMDLYLWIVNQLLLRQKHVSYLKLIQVRICVNIFLQAADSCVSEWERKYRLTISNRVAELKDLVEKMQSFDVEPIIRLRLQQYQLRPEIDQQKFVIPATSLCPIITRNLTQLLNLNVIVCHELKTADTNSIVIIFSEFQNGHWEIQITETQKTEQFKLDVFTISLEEIQNLKNYPGWIPISYGKKLITFQNSALVNFLAYQSVISC